MDRKAIAAYCAHLHEAARVALEAASIDVAGVRLTLAAYAQDGRSRHKHFKVGDHAAMAETAATWATNGFNVYSPLVANRADLKATERGGLAEAVAVFGVGADLDADKGSTTRPEDLPLQPTIVIRTSSDPAENFCAVYILARAVTVEEAKVLARGLAQVAQDADGGTSDPVHVWRIAGTLNHPKPSKLKRGRPPEPQRVALDHEDRGTGHPVSAEALSEALEVALGIESLAKTFSGSTGTSKPEQHQAGPRVYSRHDANRWNGDEREIARVEDALKRVCADNRDTWLRVGMALHDFSRGDDWAYRLWTAWSEGDASRGFQGSTSFDAQDQARTWASFDQEGARRVQIGTLFRFAQNNGWDARRKRFGLASLKETLGGAVSEDVAEVLMAAEAMPRGFEFHEAREAWFGYVLCATTSVVLARVALALSQFINCERGYGWAGFHRLAHCAQDSDGRPLDLGVTREHVRELAKMGLISLSNGRSINAAGKKGPSYALRPPPNFTWPMLLARRRLLMNHEECTAWARHGFQEQERQQATMNGIPPDVRSATPINGDSEGGIGGDGTPLNAGPGTHIGGSEAHPSMRPPGPTSGGVETSDVGSRTHIHYQREPQGEGDAPSPLPEPTDVTCTDKLADLAAKVVASPAVAGRDLAPWLDSAALPLDVAERLCRLPDNPTAKAATGDIARALAALRDLGLADDQIVARVSSSRNFVTERHAKDLAGKGKITTEQADAGDLPDPTPTVFARKLAASLGKAVDFAQGDIQRGRLIPGLRARATAATAVETDDERSRYVADWRCHPGYRYMDGPLSNGDVAALAAEFSEVDLTAFRDVIEHECQPRRTPGFNGASGPPQRPTRQQARNRARNALAKLRDAKLHAAQPPNAPAANGAQTANTTDSGGPVHNGCAHAKTVDDVENDL